MMHDHPLTPFYRDGYPIMTFRVYDGWGTCISEYTGTLPEWQREIAAHLPGKTEKLGRDYLTVVK